MVKLVMSWNIKADEESAYFEFVVQEFVPHIMRMGIRPTEAWYTVYGKGPQIITSGLAADREALLRTMVSDEWKELIEKLGAFVSDFRSRIVAA